MKKLIIVSLILFCIGSITILLGVRFIFIDTIRLPVDLPENPQTDLIVLTLPKFVSFQKEYLLPPDSPYASQIQHYIEETLMPQRGGKLGYHGFYRFKTDKVITLVYRQPKYFPAVDFRLPTTRKGDKGHVFAEAVEVERISVLLKKISSNKPPQATHKNLVYLDFAGLPRGHLSTESTRDPNFDDFLNLVDEAFVFLNLE